MLLAPLPAKAAADCNVSVSGMAFGLYDPTIAAPDDSTAAITVTCMHVGGGGATGVSYTIALSAGNSGSSLQREMRAGAPRLYYNLYSDAARSMILGDGSGGTTILSGSIKVGPGVGNGTRSETYTVYGRVPAQQAADPGSFIDLLVVTLTF